MRSTTTTTVRRSPRRTATRQASPRPAPLARCPPTGAGTCTRGTSPGTTHCGFRPGHHALRRYVLRHDRSCRDDGVTPDGDARQDGRPGADPDVLRHVDRSAAEVEPPVLHVHRVADRDERDTRRDHDTIAELDPGVVEERAALVDEHSF